MKLYHKDYAGRTGPFTPEEAVTAQVEHEAHGADGYVERLQCKVDALTHMMGRLLSSAPLTASQIADVVGYNWSGEDDR